MQPLLALRPACRINFPVPPQLQRSIYSYTSQKTPIAKRTFSSTIPQLKKAARPSASGRSSASDGIDPYDFSALKRGIEQAHAKLRDDLSKLRGGGKLNPDIIEALKVKLDKGAVTERLSNLAQVIPRGRTLQILASEAKVGVVTLCLHQLMNVHGANIPQDVKPITSAIQSSKLNLTPQVDSENSHQLNIILPPPTTEARNEAVQAAQNAADSANDAVRNARGGHQKMLRALEKARSARPDDIKRAADQMEKLFTGGIAEVKKIAESAKKVLAGG